MSRRTSGVLTASYGDPEAYLKGRSEVFIPRGGAYDISIPSVENLEQQDPQYEGYSGVGTDSFETTDTINGVAALDYSVGNLAFKRFYYSEPVSLGGAITGNVKILSNYGAISGVSGSISNTSSMTLTNVQLTYSDLSATYDIGTIGPGETKTFKSTIKGITPQVFSQRDIYSNTGVEDELYPATPSEVDAPNRRHPKSANRNSSTIDSESLYLTALLPGSNYGLPMGNDVSGGNTIAFIMNMPASVKGVSQ
jgi:hypothetical protein